MEYLYFGSAMVFGTIICSLLVFSLFSYKKLHGHVNLLLRLVHHSSKELGIVGQSMDAVLEQNNAALEKQRKVSDHQRVLLASLNRQLVTLESMFDRHQQEARSNAQLSAHALQQSRAPLNAETNEASQLARKVSSARNSMRVEEMQEQVTQAANALSENRPKPLDTLVSKGQTQESRTGARIPLAQRIRLQKHMQQKAAAENAATNGVTGNTRPAIRTRETIDLLKVKERRVANG